jgi:hypothetical protein
MNAVLDFFDSYWPLPLAAIAAICIYVYRDKLTTKLGVILMISGVAMQFLNMITYSLWGIDIDILGALVFIIGLAIAIIVKVRNRHKGKTRKTE